MKNFAPVLILLALATAGIALPPPPPPTYDVTHAMSDSNEADWLGQLGAKAASHISDWNRLQARVVEARTRARNSARRYYRASQSAGKAAYGGTFAGLTDLSVTYVLDGQGNPTEEVASVRLQGD